MRSSYDKDIYNKPNIFTNNINSSRSFFGNSSKLENLQNLYFHLNPYSNSTAIKSSQQLKELEKYQNQTEPDSLDKKYAQPNRNNYKRYHFKVEEVQKGKSLNSQSPYSPSVRDKNMAFYSLGDLSILHPLTYQKIRSTQKNFNSNNMKNNMRLQIVEEKMRKLEEKNDGLQVLNNIFFDSLKDNITQSLKRKAFLKRHLKDIEYLKKINIDEYNDKVDYLNKLVEDNNIDFDNYNYDGEPIGGAENLEGKMEAMKTEIGTLLTKNTMQNDANLNLLKKDVEDIKNELEKKLIEFNYVNNKNFDILQEYLLKEAQDRLIEKKKKEEEERIKRDKLLYGFTPSKNDKFHIKGIKKKEKKVKKVKSEESVSTESNKDLEVVDKMFLDSMTVSLKDKEKSSNTDEDSDDEDKTEKEIDLRSESSKTKNKIKKKKPKWKLLNKNKKIIEEEEDSSENKIEGDEKTIIGSYKSNFDSNKPEIINKRSKKSKRFKISKDSKSSKKDEDDEEEEENESESNGTETQNNNNFNNMNNNIEGNYKSEFNTNKPEVEIKNERSQKSKKFKLSKETKIKNKDFKNLNEDEEKVFSSEKVKSKSKSINKNSKSKNKPIEESDEDDDNEDSDEDDSNSITTETFKLTNKTGQKNQNNLNLRNLKENEEIYLASEISNLKSEDKKSKKTKKTKKSKKSKKSKAKSKRSKTVKEENEENSDE